MCVVILAHHLACVGIREDLDADYAAEVIDRKRREVDMHLRSLWHDLRAASRSMLLRLDDALEDPERQAALEDGFYVRKRLSRPRWLVERGQQIGLVLPQTPASTVEAGRMSAVERLDSLIYSINSKLLRSGETTGFATTDESRRWFLLLRAQGGEQSLIDSVNHLSKVLYEGARTPGGEKWRLPEPLVRSFKGSFGYQALVALRNFHDHDPNWGSNPEQPSTRFQNAGEIYERYSGTRHPHTADEWLLVRDGLVQDLVSALDKLETLAGQPSDVTASPLKPGT